MICLRRSAPPASKSSIPKTRLLPDSTRFPANERSKPSIPKADVELDLTPGALEKTNDPVRMYLREMGTVPLLTRDGEVEIAKRIERGQLAVLKSLSRSTVIVREIISLGEQLKKDPSIIKDLIQFSDEELTDEKVEQKLEETLVTIEEIGKTYKKVQALRVKADATPKDARSRSSGAPAGNWAARAFNCPC